MPDESLPQPLTTSDMDVRDLDGFMLNTTRLLTSELWAVSSGEEFKCAVGLWCNAWKQTPAGSLPDDDRILASFAGVTVQRWKKARGVALRGFVRCSDGRLYHRVLCEDARRAFEKKLAKRGNREGDAERKRREREDRAALFETLRAAGRAPSWNTPTSDLRIMAIGVTQPVTAPVTGHVTPPVTRTVTVITETETVDEDVASGAHAPSDARARDPEPGATPPPPVDPNARWPYERTEPWAQALVAAGAKIGAASWPRWKSLVDEHGLDAVVRQTRAHDPTAAFADEVAKRLTGARGQAPTGSATVVRKVTL